MVAAPLVATELGKEYESLPPHITIFPWFELAQSNWPKFDKVMRRVVEETVQPVIQGGDPAMFGPNGTVPVRLLNRPTQSFNIIHGFDIHAGVHGAVRRYGDDFDPSFVGLNWRPHVSDGRDFALNEDEEITLPELTVFERKSRLGSRVVKAIYRWNSSVPNSEILLQPQDVTL